MAIRSTKATEKLPKSGAKKTKAATSTAVKGTSESSGITAPKATVVGAAKAVVAAGMIKKPELVDRVVAESGLKKKDVKPVVEATLAVLTKALVNGEELQVPPLGKVKINKMKDVANAKIINVKIRHSTNDANTTPPPETVPAEVAE